MPDTQLVGFILLLAVAVAFGYFYFKRAQRRDHPPATPVDYPPAAKSDATDDGVDEQ